MTVYTIGLDGVPPNLIQDGIDSGRLPTFQKMKENGANGFTKSTVPPVSMMAWSTFATGKEPGNHGVFNFLMKGEDSYESTFADSSLLKSTATPVWEYLDSRGLQTGVMNIMPGFPASKTSGFHITDHITTPSDGDFAFPPQLQSEIEEKTNSFQLGPLTGFTGDSEASLESYVDQFFKIEHERVDVVKSLIEDYNCPAMFLVFSAPDVFLHEIGHLLDPQHPEYPKEIPEAYSDLPIQLLELFDDFLEWLTERMSETDILLVLSDHGHGPIYEAVNLNAWLYQSGYLSLDSSPLTQLKQFGYNHIYPKAETIMKKLKVYHQVKRTLARDSGGDSGIDLAKFLTISQDDIDWKETQAFTVAGDGQIYINTTEHPNGIISPADYEEFRSQLIKDIEDMKHTKTGESIIDEALKGEDVYGSEYSGTRPDIVCIPNPKYRITFPQTMQSDSFLVSPQKPAGHSSKEEQYGIFYAYGDQVDTISDITMSLADYAPTVMGALGMPIPKGMDGRFRTEIFTDIASPSVEEYQGRIKAKKAIQSLVSNIN